MPMTRRGSITSIFLPDKNNRVSDIVLASALAMQKVTKLWKLTLTSNFMA